MIIFIYFVGKVQSMRINQDFKNVIPFQISDFVVENPGDEPILVQVLPLFLYPNSQTVIDLLGDR